MFAFFVDSDCIFFWLSSTLFLQNWNSFGFHFFFNFFHALEKLFRRLSVEWGEIHISDESIIIGSCFCGFSPLPFTRLTPHTHIFHFSHSPGAEKQVHKIIKVSHWVFNFVLIESSVFSWSPIRFFLSYVRSERRSENGLSSYDEAYGVENE